MKRILSVFFTVLFITGANAADKHYNILIANDDGINAPGIIALAAALSEISTVYVVAPKENQSGASHSFLATPEGYTAVPVKHGDVFFGYAVDGRPANAVMLGLKGLYKDVAFDLVVSGINYGPNIGAISHYSGTIGAAMEAAIHGLPAIAFSQAFERKDDFQESARIATQVTVQALKKGISPGTVLNVNIPPGPLKGYYVGPMGNINFTGEFKETDSSDPASGIRLFQPQVSANPPASNDNDTAAYDQGFVTITPLQLDWTARSELPELKEWHLQLPQ